MTEQDKQTVLVAYRLQQAVETLDEALFLLEGKKSLRSVANRVYYSMFYTILALLIEEPYVSSKHSGVISFFNQKFVSTGVFPKEIGRAIHRAFELRQQGDYREHVELTLEQINPLLDAARVFLDLARTHLGKRNLLNL